MPNESKATKRILLLLGAVFFSLVVREGAYLIEKGVRFFDLTAIFKEEKRTAYTDTCCHPNPYGYSIIARRIVEVFWTNFKGKSQQAGLDRRHADSALAPPMLRCVPQLNWQFETAE